MAASKGRQPGFRMDDSHRVKIQNSNILNALIEHVEGKREMGATQVQAGIALLKKVLPDLSSVDLRGPGPEGEHTLKVSPDDAFLAVIGTLESIAARAASDGEGES